MNWFIQILVKQKYKKNDFKEEDFDESGVTLRSQPYHFQAIYEVKTPNPCQN